MAKLNNFYTLPGCSYFKKLLYSKAALGTLFIPFRSLEGLKSGKTYLTLQSSSPGDIDTEGKRMEASE